MSRISRILSFGGFGSSQSQTVGPTKAISVKTSLEEELVSTHATKLSPDGVDDCLFFSGSSDSSFSSDRTCSRSSDEFDDDNVSHAFELNKAPLPHTGTGTNDCDYYLTNTADPMNLPHCVSSGEAETSTYFYSDSASDSEDDEVSFYNRECSSQGSPKRNRSCSVEDSINVGRYNCSFMTASKRYKTEFEPISSETNICDDEDEDEEICQILGCLASVESRSANCDDTVLICGRVNNKHLWERCSAEMLLLPIQLPLL